MAEFADESNCWRRRARALPEALGRVQESCRRYLLLVAERDLDPQLRAKGGASDLVQETFLEAQRDFKGFHGNSEPELLAWLSRVLLNNLGNFSRRFCETDKRDVRREISLQAGDSSTNAERGPADSMPTLSSVAMQQEQAEVLSRALDRLPDHYRQVVVLRFQEDRSFEEIGVIMECSAEAARKLWSRAMERLRLECDKLT